jgi:site-specific recombinase XerD
MSMSASSRTALSLVEPAKADGALAAAVDAFLSQPDLAVTTRAKYRQTLAVLEVELATAPVTGAAIGGVLTQRWRDAAPATWNRHLATVRSFARYCQRNGLLDIDGDIVLDRRAEKHDQTRSIPLASLERLWERRDLALRERTLWRLLYETAARADEVLRLNVEDVDVAGKRARTRSKGGDTDWLFFGSGSARLLPRLIAGRRAGPVFLSSLHLLQSAVVHLNTLLVQHVLAEPTWRNRGRQESGPCVTGTSLPREGSPASCLLGE